MEESYASSNFLIENSNHMCTLNTQLKIYACILIPFSFCVPNSFFPAPNPLPCSLPTAQPHKPHRTVVQTSSRTNLLPPSLSVVQPPATPASITSSTPNQPPASSKPCSPRQLSLEFLLAAFATATHFHDSRSRPSSLSSLALRQLCPHQPPCLSLPWAVLPLLRSTQRRPPPSTSYLAVHFPPTPSCSNCRLSSLLTTSAASIVVVNPQLQLHLLSPVPS